MKELRIKETEKGFIVEQKIIDVDIKGIWPFQKEVKNERWIQTGQSSKSFYDPLIFDSFDKAKQYAEKIKELPKYIYL